MMSLEVRKQIRLAYDVLTPQIIQRGCQDGKGRLDPYIFPWHEIFSPIEDLAWQEIRRIGVPLYPQYPADRYCLDFANPYLRIALEVDGKAWHQDVQRDRERDANLLRDKWHVFHCSGREVYAREGETVAEVLTAMAVCYGVWGLRPREEWECHHVVLLRHQLIQFTIPYRWRSDE